jgi:hypothetical protein
MSSYEPQLTADTTERSVAAIGGRVLRSPATIAAVALSLVVLKYGVDLHPNSFRFSEAVGSWPDLTDSLLAVGDRALLSNAAPAWLAGALGLQPGTVYLGFSLALTVAALGLPFAMRCREVDRAFLPRYGVLLIGGSLAPVLLMWVGGYDALLVIGLTIGALARSAPVSTLGWFVASVTHASVAMPAALVWLVFRAASGSTQGPRLRYSALSAIVGLGVGFAVIRAATDAWGGSTDRLALFQAIPYELIWQAFIGALPAILFSGLGIGWLLVLLPSCRRLRATRVFVACAACVVLAAPLVAVDETRITALILVPVILAWLDAWATQADSAPRLPRWVVAAAVIVPIPVVWMGIPYWPYWL